MTTPQFGFLLADSARLLRRAFDRKARLLGFNRAQWQVLAFVSRREGSTQAEMADTLELQPITLVRLLDRLEKAGLIERRADPADRRVRRLFLTPAAHPALEEMHRLGAELRAVALDGVPEAQRELLNDLLGRIRGNLVAAESVPRADAAE